MTLLGALAFGIVVAACFGVIGFVLLLVLGA